MIDEAQVINRLLSGDAAAADKIVNKYEAMVYQYCLYFLGSDADAQDASAQVFVRFFAQIVTDSEERSLEELVMRATVTVCMEWQRRSRVNRKKENKTLEEQIHITLQRLVRQQRAILLLRDMTGMTEKEIAYVMGIKEQMVSLRITRARNNLCDFLLQDGADLGLSGEIIDRKSRESQNYHEICSRYVDGNTSEEEKKQLLDHIQTCESCANYLQALTRIGRELLHMGEGKMPDSLKENILKEVRQQAERASIGHRKRKYVPTVVLISAACIFVVMVCSGVLGGTFSNSSDAYADNLLHGSAGAKKTVERMDFRTVRVPDSVSANSYSFAIAASGGKDMPELSTEARLIAADSRTGDTYYTINSDVASAEKLCKNLESFGYETWSIDSGQIMISGSASAALIVIMGQPEQ